MLNSRAEFAPGIHAPSTAATLAQAIENLLRLLASPSPEGRASSDPPTESWEDEEYSYIETQIEYADLAICDISIAQGRAFIRILKAEVNDEAGEHMPRLVAIDPNESPIES